MADSHSERKHGFDGESVLIGALLAVFTQSLYDTFKTYYILDFANLGPYFPSLWAGVVTALIIVGIFFFRNSWKKRDLHSIKR
jgi:hypothetical protein